MIHTASTVKQPKRRQTCDPCRKAKIKCDKRTPICGRCLATGDLCDYGISRQGAWWRHRARAKAVEQQQQHQLSMLTPAKLEAELDLAVESLLSSTAVVAADPGTASGCLTALTPHSPLQHVSLGIPPPFLPLTLPISPPTHGANSLDYQAALHNDKDQLPYPCFNGDKAPQALRVHTGQFTPPYSINSSPEDKKDTLTTAAAFCSASTAANPFCWPQSPSIAPRYEHHQQDDKRNAGDLSRVSNPMLARRIHLQQANPLLPPHRCACLSLILQALQIVEECLAVGRVNDEQHSQTGIAAESARVLEINERSIDSCWAVLQCESCCSSSTDSNSALPPITLIYTLIERELLWVEHWTFTAEGPGMPANNDPMRLPLIDAMSDVHMKIGVAEAVVERWNALLERLGESQAYQSSACEFTCLAHALLLESLRARLACLSEKTSQKINEPCLAVIKSIETFGMGGGDASLSQLLHAA